MALQAERIDAGVDQLDEHFPDWLERVLEDRLAVASLDFCPLGQASGKPADRNASMYPLSYRSEWGFDVTYGNGETFDGLTRAWKRKIRQLKKERGIV